MTLNANGSFEFVPTTSFTGSQTFTYTINDGNGNTGSAQATINASTVFGTTVYLQDEPGDTGGRDGNSTINNIEGTTGRDTLNGNSNANIIDGNERADVTDGKDGNDILIGGTDTVTD